MSQVRSANSPTRSIESAVVACASRFRHCRPLPLRGQHERQLAAARHDHPTRNELHGTRVAVMRGTNDARSSTRITLRSRAAIEVRPRSLAAMRNGPMPSNDPPVLRALATKNLELRRRWVLDCAGNRHDTVVGSVPHRRRLLNAGDSRYGRYVYGIRHRGKHGIGSLAALVVFVASLSRMGHTAPVETPGPVVPEATDLEKSRAALVEWASRHRVGLSLSVAILPSMTTLVTYQASVARNPASVSKLVTALVALRTLGQSYHFKTRLYGQLVAGKLDRLVVRGEGDPSLSSDTVQGMAARLVAMGLTRIDGPIVVDQSYFDEQFVPPAFEQQPNEWAAFRAPVCATAVDGNRLALHVIPGLPGANARVYLEPLGAAEISGTIVSAETTAAGGQRVRFSVTNSSGRPSVRIGGEIGANGRSVMLQKRADDPRLIVGYVLREALRARGVTLNGGVTLGGVDAAPVLLTHTSEALSSLLHHLGKKSDNFVAEMLLKTIGARVAGVGSTAAGAKRVLEMLVSLGATQGELRWINGSGLFDANRISTDALVGILGTAHRDRRLAPEYLSQLALGGQDGTLSTRLRGLPEGCHVRAKTGTLRANISLAGYVDRRDDKTLAFAIVTDDVKSQPATRAAIDGFVSSLCNSTLEPAFGLEH